MVSHTLGKLQRLHGRSVNYAHPSAPPAALNARLLADDSFPSSPKIDRWVGWLPTCELMVEGGAAETPKHGVSCRIRKRVVVRSNLDPPFRNLVVSGCDRLSKILFAHPDQAQVCDSVSCVDQDSPSRSRI